jgi:hypothetical protein
MSQNVVNRHFLSTVQYSTVQSTVLPLVWNMKHRLRKGRTCAVSTLWSRYRPADPSWIFGYRLRMEDVTRTRIWRGAYVPRSAQVTCSQNNSAFDKGCAVRQKIGQTTAYQSHSNRIIFFMRWKESKLLTWRPVRHLESSIVNPWQLCAVELYRRTRICNCEQIWNCHRNSRGNFLINDRMDLFLKDEESSVTIYQ